MNSRLILCTLTLLLSTTVSTAAQTDPKSRSTPSSLILPGCNSIEDYNDVRNRFGQMVVEANNTVSFPDAVSFDLHVRFYLCMKITFTQYSYVAVSPYTRWSRPPIDGGDQETQIVPVMDQAILKALNPNGSGELLLTQALTDEHEQVLHLTIKKSALIDPSGENPNTGTLLVNTVRLLNFIDPNKGTDTVDTQFYRPVQLRFNF